MVSRSENFLTMCRAGFGVFVHPTSASASASSRLGSITSYVVVDVDELAAVLGLPRVPAQMIKGLKAAGARLIVLQ